MVDILIQTNRYYRYPVVYSENNVHIEKTKSRYEEYSV